MKVAITGASGFVGRHLQKVFPQNIHIHRYETVDEILKKLEGVSVVINLAGAPIIKRWTPQYKKMLLDSRVETTKTLVEAINKSDVKHFISTSAVGAYPDNGIYDESFDGYANDFLGELTRQWESVARECNKPTAIVRFGIVLGSDGGALQQMLTPFKLGVGGTIGDGRMMMSWVDIDDLVRVYQYLIEKELTGVFNVVSPQPVSNYEFTKTLGSVLKRPTVFPVPSFILKLIYSEGASVLTGSKEVYPKALLEQGFKFEYPTIEKSLNHLLSK